MFAARAGDPKNPQLPSDFQTMEAFKTYTSKVFLKKFEEFIDEWSYYGKEELISKDTKDYYMRCAQQVALRNRGRGMESWQALQAFRQCLNAEETSEHLKLIGTLAVAYFAEFAAYEILDDLPLADNDPIRREGHSLWKWHEQTYGKTSHPDENAMLFAWQLSTFASHLLHSVNLSQETKNNLALELREARARVLAGQAIRIRREDYAQPDVLAKTLQCHDLKAAWFTAALMKGVARAAGADERIISRMGEFGRACARAGQIINDARKEDIENDMKKGSPNIIAAAGRGNLQEGTVIAAQLFKDYLHQAREILHSFDHPNRHLAAFLKMQEKRFNENISTLPARSL